MFKIIKFNCCGLDVHKTWIYACIGITDTNFRTEYFEARFSSFPKEMLLTAIWNILSTGEVYNPSGYILQSPRPMDEKKVLTQKQALDLLRLRGFTIVVNAPSQDAPA